MSGSDQNPEVENDPAGVQMHVERLSQEVLELYRQVNLFYRLGDVFGPGLAPDEICRLLIKESAKVVRARSAQVVLADGFKVGQVPSQPASRLKVGIETLEGRLGEITLYDKKAGFFTAADEKLIRAVAQQAGVALENSRRIHGLVRQNQALERLNAELRAIDQMKSDFVSNVSHELRTPLSSIKGFASTIMQDSEMPLEVAQEFVGIINEESDKLIVIINDLLDVSKMLSGHLQYNLQVQPLEQIVEKVVTLLGIQAEAKGLALGFELIDVARVNVDATRISQVFTNLVANAVKFTDAGTIRVQQWVAEGRVHVSVADTGIGIREDVLAHIFDKFYRVENVVHTKEGTGLGLALVRGIVDYHGGSVDVRSTEGEGSVFTVQLPLAP